MNPENVNPASQHPQQVNSAATTPAPAFRFLAVLPRFLLVSLVLVLFLLLRWDFWPKPYFPDELIPVAVVQHMVQTGTLDTNWDNADWRGDYAAGVYNLQQYNFSSYHVSLRVLRWLASPWLAAVPDIVFYRQCSVLFQWLALLLVMDLVRRLAGWPLAGVAGLFVAVMPHSVIDAHYARPETFVTLLVALALWLGWHSCRSQSLRWSDGVAALVWGVAFACKISLLPMALVAWGFMVWRMLPVPGSEGGYRLAGKDWLSGGCWLFGWWLLFTLGFALSAPQAFANPHGFLAGAGFLFAQYSPDIRVAGETAFASAGQLLAYMLAFFGGPAWLLMLLSLRVQQPSLRWLVLAGLAATLFYGVFFAYQKVFFERNLSHLIPLWALLFAIGAGHVGAVVMRVPGLGRVGQPGTATRIVHARLLAIVLCGFLLERAWLSHGIVAAFFGGSTVVAEQVDAFEQPLLLQQQRTQVARMQPLRDYQHLSQFASDALLQVPRYKLPEQAALDALLLQAGWVPVARLDLPFGFLPYNQLQINHAPVAYDYYVQLPAGGRAP